MNFENLKYWMALKSIDGIGNSAFLQLLDCFGSPSSVFSATINELSTISGINKKSAKAILSFKEWDKIACQLDLLNKMNVHVITYLDERYPQKLLNIYDRPVLLYVLGNLEKDDIPIAIVGSRHASPYGKYTTEKISRELAQKGIAIVSGMARGIDSCAHRGALSVQGRTIAVLGTGLDVVYPPENKKLFSAISKNGAVISEFPLGTQPLPYHFPARNRIISGMSWGVLVVEAGERSGSLITARLANEQGREVFAIPGTIDSPSSRGTNSLIKQGAKLIENIDDILEDILPQLERRSINPKPPTQEFTPNASSIKDAACLEDKLDPNNQKIVNILYDRRLHADDIISATGLTPATVISALITLELRGIIIQHPGNLFSLKKY